MNYKSKYIKNELEKVIESKIPIGEFEQMWIVSLLENINNEKGDLVEILEHLYDHYCRGYYFLRKREILIDNKPKMVNEARRLLTFFQDGLLVINTVNEYDDYRTEEEKLELHYIEKMFND